MTSRGVAPVLRLPQEYSTNRKSISFRDLRTTIGHTSGLKHLDMDHNDRSRTKALGVSHRFSEDYAIKAIDESRVIRMMKLEQLGQPKDVASLVSGFLRCGLYYR